VRPFVLAIALFLVLPASSAFGEGTLTVGISGVGSVAGGKIDCRRDLGDKGPSGICSESIPKCSVKGCTDEATIAARGARGFVLDGWKGACEGQRDRCSIEMLGDASTTAIFRDAQPPTVTLDKPGTGPVAGTIPVEVTAGDNAAVARVEFSVRGVVKFVDTAAPYGGGFDTETVADGSAPITATVFDSSGLSASSTVDVKIDNTKPALTVTGPDKQRFLPGSTQSWEISASDPGSGIAEVRCSVVPINTAPSFGNCTSAVAFVLTNQPEGTFTFNVRATDRVGNFAQTGRDFKIDGTAPETTITSGIGEGETTTETSLTWAFEAGETASFECRVHPAALTPGAFAPCSGAGGHTAAGFAPGVYTFEARAIDLAGNVDASPAKRTFTVEPGPPVAPPTPKVGTAATAKAGPAPQIVVTLGFSFTSIRKATKLANLVVKNLPAGSTVTVKCPKGCANKTFKKAKARGQLLLKPVVKKPLKLGTEITVIVSKPGFSSAVKVLKIRARKAPLVTTLCQPEGSSKPAAC
jgi:hypothetical protein